MQTTFKTVKLQEHTKLIGVVVLLQVNGITQNKLAEITQCHNTTEPFLGANFNW